MRKPKAKKKSGAQRMKEERERHARELEAMRAKLRARGRGGKAAEPDDDQDDDELDAPASSSSKALPVHQTDPKVDAGVNPSMWAAVPLVPPATPDEDEPKSEEEAAAAAAAGEQPAAGDGKEEPVTAGIPNANAKPPPAPDEANGAKTIGGLLVGVWTFGGVVTAQIVHELAPELEQLPEPVQQVIASVLGNWTNPAVTSVIAGAGERVALKYGIARIVKTPDEAIVGGVLLVPALAMVALKRIQQRKHGDASSSSSSETTPPPAPRPRPRVVDAHAVEVHRPKNGANGANGAGGPTPPTTTPPKQDWSGIFGNIPERGRSS